MEIISTFTKNSTKLNVYGSFEDPLFLAQEVGDMLGLNRVRDSLVNMNVNFKVAGQTRTPGGLQQTYFLKEPGLYWLLMRSNKTQAIEFQNWICQDVIPSIRKSGKYEITHKCPKRVTFRIETEYDLHTKVVSFLKKQFPESIFTASLGEMQDSAEKRIKAFNLGYMKGSADLIIHNLHNAYTSFAIEFKSPKTGGVISDSQAKMMNAYKDNGFKVLISNDYDEIIMQIIEYFKDVRIKCQYCSCKFKSKKTIKNHHKYFHKIEN
jgi:prophage antirepressor-like protein